MPTQEPELSARELDVVRLIAKGSSQAEAGRSLGIASGTVKVHLNNIYTKLRIHSAVDLTRWAIQEKLV